MENSKEPNLENQKQLESLIPGVDTLEKAEQMQLHGLVRRAILQEQQAVKEAVNIFKPEEMDKLINLKQQLPSSTEIEIKEKIIEFGLDEEESESEFSNWAFRHQSTRGEMMVDEKLIPFQIVRVSEFQYLLLVEQQDERVMRAFIPVFEKTPDISLKEAFKSEDHTWAGWIWLTEPDELRVAILKDQIKAMWEGSEDDVSNHPGK